MSVSINLRCSNGKKVALEDIDLSITIEQFKKDISEKVEIPPEQQRLVYSGHVLKDNQTLESYGVKATHTIHVVKSAANNLQSQNTTPTQTQTQTQTQPQTQNQTTQPTPNLNQNPFGNLGMGMGGFGGMGGMGGMGMGQSFEDMQRQMQQNPQLMQEMMNSPLMQNLMNNPELMSQIMLSNPQIQALMERNPELAHILNDPVLLRQSLEMARNPNMMREMQRNTDRAMQNIEMLPEGFNHLRRMYTNIQEPMMEASLEHGRNLTGQNQNANQVPIDNTAQNAPNTSALPNPWAPSNPQSQQSQQQSQQQQQQQQQQTNPLFPQQTINPTQFPGANMNPENLATAMNDPMFQQLMGQLMSNPDLLESMLANNPQYQNDPNLRQMIRDPAFLATMRNPQTIQAILQMQAAMQQLQNTPLFGSMQSGPTPGVTGQQAPQNPFSLFGFPTGFSQSQSQPQSQAQPQSNVFNENNMPEYEQRFASQLQQLRDMGFPDTVENIRALLATGGNVNSAIDRLLR